MTSLSHETMDQTFSKKKTVCLKLKEVLKTRFSDFDNPLFDNMRWVDPQYWIGEEKMYGIDQIQYLCEFFKQPLNATNFDEVLALREWKTFKNHVRGNYAGLNSHT